MLFCSAEPLVSVDLWRRIRVDPKRTVTLVWNTVSLHIIDTLYPVWYTYCYCLKCIGRIMHWTFFVYFEMHLKITIQAICVRSSSGQQ